MGGFSAQAQPTQSSSPAGKGAGMSSMQLGMNPIQESPEKQMMKMQELQMEQPDFAQANQIQPNMENGTQLGGLGGAMQNPYQANLNSANSPLLGGPVQQNPMLGTPNPMSAQPSQQGIGYVGAVGPQPSQGKGSSPSQNIGFPQTTGMMGGQVTLPGQGGQPQLGMPNAYSNTMQPWDNQGQQPQSGAGKGMGGGINSQSAQNIGRIGKGA